MLLNVLFCADVPLTNYSHSTWLVKSLFTDRQSYNILVQCTCSWFLCQHVHVMCICLLTATAGGRWSATWWWFRWRTTAARARCYLPSTGSARTCDHHAWPSQPRSPVCILIIPCYFVSLPFPRGVRDPHLTPCVIGPSPVYVPNDI